MGQIEDFYIGEDGKLHQYGKHGQKTSEIEGISGGYKVVPKLVEKDGKYHLTKEIINTASGSYFYSDDPSTYFSSFKNAFRSANPDRKELLEEGYRLWKYDPLGGTVVNLTTYFVMGRGLTINYDDPMSEKVLLKFWKKNKMWVKSKQMCDEGTAYGENFIRLKVHKKNKVVGGKNIWRAGDVEFCLVDPMVIDSIRHAADDVNNVYSYYLSHTDDKGRDVSVEVKDISKFNLKTDTECILHIKFNSSSNDPFGLSDFIRIKEWLDNYQEFLRDGVIINKLYRSPCYDIKIIDGTEDDVKNAKSRYSGWKIGSNPVHNDKEEWDILEFTGTNTSAEVSRRALLLIIAAGVDFPEYMLADGSNSNLASTKSQQLPAVKRFEDRQDTYGESLIEIFDFVLNAKQEFGTVDLKPEKDFEEENVWKGKIEFPVIAQEEDSIVAKTTVILSDAGLISKSTASMINGNSYNSEVSKMRADANLLAQTIADTKKEIKGKGLSTEEVDAIIAKFFQLEVIKDEIIPPGSSQKPKPVSSGSNS